MGIAYDFDRNRQADDDKDVSTIIGSEFTTLRGATATDDRIAILIDGKIVILDHDWNRITSEDITITFSGTLQGICATDDRWGVLRDRLTNNFLNFWYFNGKRADTLSASDQNWRGIFSDGTYIYIIRDSPDDVVRRTYTNTTLTTFISSLGAGSWQGGTSTDDRFLIVNNFGDTGVFYDHSGVLQASEKITLPSGTYTGVMAVPSTATVPDASTGLAIDDKDDDSVDISWTDGDDGGSPITDHQYRITTGANPGGTPVSTGSTATTHTIPNLMPSTEYTVQVRAVNAEGNSAWSSPVTFTTETRVTLTASPTSLAHGESATVTIQLSAAATDFVEGEVSVMGGTKGAFTAIDGDTYTVIATAPDSGRGRITVSVAADVLSVGNPAVSITIAYAADPNALGMEAIDEQFISVGTRDYVLTIDIFGNPDNVKPEGLREGFYHDWDSANQQLHIKSNRVTRLLMGATWTVLLTKGSDTFTGTVLYNVVPPAPIIEDPGARHVFRGVNNYKFVKIANNPSIARSRSLLVGLKYESETDEDGNPGIAVTGGPPTDARFTETTFDETYYAENDSGADRLTKSVEILDKPTLFLGLLGAQIYRTNKDRSVATNPPIMRFGVGDERGLMEGMIIGTSQIQAVLYFPNTIHRYIQFSKFGAENSVVSLDSDIDVSGITMEPRGLAAAVNANMILNGNRFYILDGANNRVIGCRLNAEHTAITADDRGNLPSSITKPRGIFVDANEDMYILDLANRRIHVRSEFFANNSTLSFSRAFTLPTKCTTPSDITIDGNDLWVCESGDPGEDFAGTGSTVRVYKMDKNTANNTTAVATATYTFNEIIDKRTTYLAAIGVDAN